MKLKNLRLTKSSLFLSILLMFILIVNVAFAQYGQTQRYYLVGSIGDDAIQMDLTLSDGTASGTYFYEDDGPLFSFSGNLIPRDDDSRNSVWELGIYSDASFETNGLETSSVDIGSFDMELVNPRFHYDGPDSEFDNVVLRGTWSGGGGVPTLPFEAYAVAEYVFLTVTNGDHIDIDMSYPYFYQEPWQGLNNMVTGNISSNIEFFQQGQLESQGYKLMGWGSSDSIRIHYFSESLVSLEDAGWIYLGGAHGSSASVSRNLARVEGDWLELELRDFFDDGVDFVTELEPNIMLGLEQKEAAWVVDGSTDTITLDDLYSVLVSPRGLDISFDPYHMGPYAQGTIQVNIPFEYVGPILNEEGPLKEVLELSGFDINDY